eukprot:TRINITY_DN1317_c0_g1_i5.p1 TRINITY_DN1317_c0_g1~~TRINITY_DN1317_c0_g1_i5.p1  ORF type:complete len:288 (-),score=58.86 TRINITY_DN1317_c0_g1_i5:997-1860(-)
MQVKFVPDTHYFFSVGKDKVVKYWNADKFEQIMTLRGHHAEVWSLAVAASGSFVVSGSNDRSIRVWEQTEEQLFIAEEREVELEALFDKALENPLERGPPVTDETSRAGKRTIASVSSGERILEALEFIDDESKKVNSISIEEAADVTTKMNIDVDDASGAGLIISAASEVKLPHPLFRGLKPSEYLYQIVRRIKYSDLEEALVVLPFTYVLRLLQYIELWIRNGKEVERCLRCLLFLAKIHHYQLGNNTNFLLLLKSLQQNAHKRIQEQKEVFGFNKAALQFYLQK